MRAYTLLLLLSTIFAPFVTASYDEQVVIMPVDTEPFYTPTIHAKPSLADLLTIEAAASIFYSYARELELSRLFSESNEYPLTVLVPTNKAVMALARKPHQGQPIDDDIVITEEEYDSISKENVERWIRAHIIPAAISLEGAHEYDTLLPEKKITFKTASGSGPDWSRTIVADGVKIINLKEGSNGRLVMIDGAITVE